MKTQYEEYLKVFLRGSYIGNLYHKEASLSFMYADDYLSNPNALKISASLPLQEGAFGHFVTAAFFSGLLPDEDVRRRLARYLRISEKNTFALLKEIGGECAGAISLYPENIEDISNDLSTYRILENNEALDVLESLEKRPFLAGDGDIRISGAGAQDKLMIAFVNGKIAIPTNTTPSTHIIKPNIKGLKDTVQNEFFSMRLAKAIGLPVPEVQIIWLEQTPFYVVERYDRRIRKTEGIVRLHQEDFCQALQISPEMKYENEGGPSIVDCFSLLESRIKLGKMAGINKMILLRGIIFNFMIGNGDAHGKNFSLLYDGSSEQLAPFYDLLSTVIYADSFKAKMAMKISCKYNFKEVSLRHFETLGDLIGFRKDFIKKQILSVGNNVLNASKKLMNELNSDPRTSSDIYLEIHSIVEMHCKKIMMS
jgi:serine/threonine-protein kinase HipA